MVLHSTWKLKLLRAFKTLNTVILLWSSQWQCLQIGLGVAFLSFPVTYLLTVTHLVSCLKLWAKAVQMESCVVKVKWTSPLVNQGGCGGCCRRSQKKAPASVPECSPLPHTVYPPPGPASQVQLDCSTVREPRTVGGQRLCTARLSGTQLASAYQWWITDHQSHDFTNWSTNKGSCGTFCGTSRLPGDWRATTR